MGTSRQRCRRRNKLCLSTTTCLVVLSTPRTMSFDFRANFDNTSLGISSVNFFARERDFRPNEILESRLHSFPRDSCFSFHLHSRHHPHFSSTILEIVSSLWQAVALLLFALTGSYDEKSSKWKFVLSNPDFFFLFKFARKRISMDRDDSVS